jgi:hypothetical protein
LREIVNKTNIAEAKAGVHLSDIDLEKMAKDEDDDELNTYIKQESNGDGDDDGGLSQLAKLLTAENQEELVRAGNAHQRHHRPRSDAIAAILASAGVEYTHENSEVIGTSRVEAQLSRHAELVDNGNTLADDDPEGNSALFADSQANHVALPSSKSGAAAAGAAAGANPWRMHYRFNPPKDVMRRQFCSMAREFGFPCATDFALVVESWTQEQRRNCLDAFYRLREGRVLERELAAMRKEQEGELEEAAQAGGGVKKEVKLKDKVIEDGTIGKTAGGGVVVKAEKPVSPRGLSPLVQVKTEKTEAKRVSTIFLSDDDEDDEL